MALPIRVEYPGAVYHVICRGNNRQAISRDDPTEGVIWKSFRLLPGEKRRCKAMLIDKDNYLLHVAAISI